ncbi:MAG TPA: hypothetical protein VNU47_00135 [Candidatus Paceibacterota bacterium]|nr:hypothetical protein [Candidatus Paceibacterota bacterium]
MRLFALSLIAALFFIPSLTAVAQGLPTTEPLSVSISPQYPRPYQTITITPRSYGVNLTSSTVVISVNGTEIERGSGLITGYARLGGPGERTTIRVSVTTNGQTQQREVIVRPAEVALVAEPLTTTHPFYKGAPLVASEGRVRLVAIPDIRTAPGTSVAPQNLVYTWRLGNRILESSSGIGKSVIDAVAPIRYRDATVSVTVTSQDSTLVAYAETVVAPVDPIIRIYRNDPLLGPLFDTAFSGEVVMSTEEETFRAVPYYFGSTPAVTWTMNSIESGYDKDITVRSTGAGIGSAILAASARGSLLFQSAESMLTVRFGELRPLGIFGL